MPIGPYKDFDTCVKAQVAKGHSIDSARRICGAIERDTKKSQQQTAGGIAVAVAR